MDRRLRRRIHTARNTIKAIAPIPPITAAVPIPAFSPVLRPGAGVLESGPLELDVDAAGLVELDTRMLKLEVRETEPLEVLDIESVAVLDVESLELLDVESIEIEVIAELLVVAIEDTIELVVEEDEDVLVSTVPGVYPGKRLIAPPLDAGRLARAGKEIGAANATFREPVSSGQ